MDPFVLSLEISNLPRMCHQHLSDAFFGPIQRPTVKSSKLCHRRCKKFFKYMAAAWGEWEL